MPYAARALDARWLHTTSTPHEGVSRLPSFQLRKQRVGRSDRKIEKSVRNVDGRIPGFALEDEVDLTVVLRDISGSEHRMHELDIVSIVLLRSAGTRGNSSVTDDEPVLLGGSPLEVLGRVPILIDTRHSDATARERKSESVSEHRNSEVLGR